MPKKKGGGSRKAAETPEEKAMRLEMERIKAIEDEIHRAGIMRHNLETSLKAESEMCKLNLAKIQHSWRKIMRESKVQQLKHEVEIMSQNHEREVDMKDAIIQMLDRDLDEAEEQYQTAHRSHLRNMDALVKLFDAKMAQLRDEFHAEQQQIIEDFTLERTTLLDRHQRLTQELSDVLDLQEEQFQAAEEDQRQEFESLCEEIKNKNMEDLNVLRMILETQIEELEEHFQNAAESYSANTKDKVKKFKEYTNRDRKDAQTIDSQMKRLLRLQDNLVMWRAKIQTNTEESVTRNKLLRQEKEAIQAHFTRSKNGMNKMREEQARLLQTLSLQCDACRTTLDTNLDLATKILNVAELNRKMETEREKIVPFYPTLQMGEEEDALLDEAVQFRDELSSLSSYARSQTGKHVERWNLLDNFLRKYNSVLLDKEAIKKERGRLLQENGDLRSILKQYLDGISVNNQVLAGANPLMVVNERSNIQTQPPAVARTGPTTIIEGNVAVDQQYYPAAPLGW